MNKILEMIEEKVSPKYLLYLKENDYELFKNIEKEESSLSTNLIDNKIFEVLDIFEKESDTLYLIGGGNNELGWVSVLNPILILNSFSEEVSVIDSKNENELNNVLGINSRLKINTMYTSKYICSYKGNLYSGLENNYEFIGFYPLELLNFGNIEKLEFSFKNSMVKVYESQHLIKAQMIVTDNQKYSTTKYYSQLEKGIVKIGKSNYWFKLDDTTINSADVVSVTKEFDEYYLEHLIQSIRIEKSVKAKGQVSATGVNQEYIKNLNERTNKLKEKNEKYIEINRNLSKELKNEKLNLRRKSSKIDYFERLTDNQNNKLEYYEERNKKLENRIELLEKKLHTVNSELKQLKNGKLIRIQSKFFGK